MGEGEWRVWLGGGIERRVSSRERNSGFLVSLQVSTRISTHISNRINRPFSTFTAASHLQPSL